MVFNETEALAIISSVFEDNVSFATAGSADAIWILICGFLVFFMHAGFAMLEAGSVRYKNSVNIMFKNIGTITISAITYYFLGFGFAYGTENRGEATSAFIGVGSFVLDGIEDADKNGWFFQFAFCATAATIVSGAVAGRISLGGYFICATWLTAFVYPVVSHWVWSSDGFLSAFLFEDPNNPNNTAYADPILSDFYEDSCGVFDYAGSGVVHMTGGVAAFWGALILGPRIGRFERNPDNTLGEPVDLPGHNISLATLGTFILWFGWYGFNCGSTLAFDGDNAEKVAITTTLAPASACIASIILQKYRTGNYDLISALNSILAGLVSITAGCSTVSDWSAIMIGVIGAFVYQWSSELLLKLKIDDPIGASPVHGFAGVWGVLAVGIFGTAEGVASAYTCPPVTATGLGTLPVEQFVIQLILVICIICWVSATMAPLFFILKQVGILRVSEESEETGLDVSEHGGNNNKLGA